METFDQLLSSFTSELKALGFTRTKQTFYYRQEDNWGMINFQKSRSGSKEKVLFTINLGIYSKALNDYFQYNSAEKPGIVHCHWTERIGSYLSPRRDKWWTIDVTVSASAIRDEIFPVLREIAVPVIQSHITDEMLIAAWRNGEPGGNTEGRIEEFVSVLTNKL